MAIGLTAAGMATGLAGLAAAWWWQRRLQADLAARRAAIFDDCRSVLQSVEVAGPGSDYPLLRGVYRGRRCMLQPLLDHVGYRKVPSLWLVMTVDEVLPLGGKVDILFRPDNIEFYSSIEQLPERIQLEPDWPQHHMARVGPAGWQPPLDVMHAALGDVIDDPDLKELVLTPRGLRLVVRICSVERAHYMVLRSLLPEVERIPSDWLRAWLDATVRLESALCQAAARTT